MTFKIALKCVQLIVNELRHFVIFINDPSERS